MGIDASVSAEGNTNPALECLCHVLLRGGNDDGSFFYYPRRKMHLRLMFFKPEQGIRRGHEKCVVLLHELDAFIIQENAMFDGVHAGAYRILDRNCGVSVGR